MPLFDMHCENEKCSAYKHTESYLLKKHNQKVKCGGCGNVLEKEVSAPNIGRSRNQNSNFPIPPTIVIPTKKTLPCGHTINVTEMHHFLVRNKKNYVVPNSLN